MTLQLWIDSRVPAPPPALAIRMRPAVDAVSTTDERRAGGRALDAAMTLVESIVRDGSGARTGAITLLAADALVTYAFEAASEDPEGLEALAAEAMLRIAAAERRAR